MKSNRTLISAVISLCFLLLVWEGEGRATYESYGAEFSVIEHFFGLPSYQPENVDITITVHCTADRLSKLESLAEDWSGPVSAAVYVQTHSMLAKLVNHYKGSPILQKYADIHVVKPLTVCPYPINVLRNVGLRNANTSLVFPMDVDFRTSQDLRSVILAQKDLVDQMLHDKILVIAPAFQMIPGSEDIVPKTKKELLVLVMLKKAQQVHAYFQKGHAPVNYRRWLRGTDNYYISYKKEMEPYFIGSREMVLYDERFLGRGGNKQSHLYELDRAGYQYLVHGRVFLMHQCEGKKKKSLVGNQNNNKNVLSDYMEEKRQHYFRLHHLEEPAEGDLEKLAEEDAKFKSAVNWVKYMKTDIEERERKLEGERGQMAVNLAHCLNLQKRGDGALSVAGLVSSLHLEPLCGEHVSSEGNLVEKFDDLIKMPTIPTRDEEEEGVGGGGGKQGKKHDMHTYHGSDVSFVEVGVMQTVAAAVLLVALRVFTVKARGSTASTSASTSASSKIVRAREGAGSLHMRTPSADLSSQLLSSSNTASLKAAKKNILLVFAVVIVVLAALSVEGLAVEEDSEGLGTDLDEENESVTELVKSYAGVLMALLGAYVAVQAAMTPPSEGFPFGLSRIEYLASIITSATVLISCLHECMHAVFLLTAEEIQTAVVVTGGIRFFLSLLRAVLCLAAAWILCGREWFGAYLSSPQALFTVMSSSERGSDVYGWKCLPAADMVSKAVVGHLFFNACVIELRIVLASIVNYVLPSLEGDVHALYTIFVALFVLQFLACVIMASVRLLLDTNSRIDASCAGIVKAVHDEMPKIAVVNLRVWDLSATMSYAVCTVEVPAEWSLDEVRGTQLSVRDLLRKKFGINDVSVEGGDHAIAMFPAFLLV
eukprot:CAMPEP_0113880072 /NCGR_PEP_ID=MMETSP0780_2-20120614/7587_1 /TAXON_ID=652834 /ORGANISM="Palpitomonas bilix" /LENGTH=879 /DNA_ID=CAMNT_0000866717 /DNA_START=494 /DNA_END=3134 /DNA_ORIENTATION=- /assembly_acc=CAM_ASM_000599